MSISNGLVTKPIGLFEVTQMLGEKSMDIGTVCTSDNIRKWSRCKPIKCSGVEPIDEAKRKANTYGLKIPILSGTFRSCIDEIVNQTEKTKWDYIKPTGGLASPYRLTDFEYYYHHANPPFPYTYQNKFDLYVYEGEGEITVRFDRWVDEAPEGLGFPSFNVKLEDLITSAGAGNYDFQNFKFAVVLVNPLGSTDNYRLFESAGTLADDDFNVKITSSRNGTQNELSAPWTYTCYPILFFREDYNQDLFVVIPTDNASFTLETHRVDTQVTDIRITLDGRFLNGVPDIDVIIDNISHGEVRLQECKLAFWKVNDDGERYDECYLDFNGTFTIPANGQTTIFTSEGTWRFGNTPTYNVDEITWMQFQSVTNGGLMANSAVTECW